MKTKPAESIATAFPTCGEVFHHLVVALDLTAWADAFHDSKAERRREASDIKALSDQLRDWATEVEGRVPSRKELEEFICRQVDSLPRKEEIGPVLVAMWQRVLEEHTGAVRENTTYLDRKGTRAWYARMQAPGTLYFLWDMQRLLRRVAKSHGPVLDVPLNELLAKAWADGADPAPGHPLQLACYKYYAELRVEDSSPVDPKTIAAWKAGEDRPSCDALGRHFAKFSDNDKLGLVLNFAFAGLLEALANTLRAFVSREDWPDCRQLLLGQAHCLHCLDETVAQKLECTPNMSLPDYERLLSECLGAYMRFLSDLPRGGLDALDLRIAKFRVYQGYQQRFLETQIPPRNFGDFCGRMERLWRETSLKAPRLNSSDVEDELARLRAEYPAFSCALAGPLFDIEARVMLCQEPPTRESLQKALTLYQEAFDKSRYQAGVYTARVVREALGLAALLHRHEIGEGSIKPWMKKVLKWWDLLGFGPDFDHERLEQRIELAESRFTDALNKELRGRLKAALPQLGLNHFYVGGMFGFAEPELIEKLEAKPVDRRQKKPIASTDTIVGRDQSPLMEAIDRGQLDLARELVRKGTDLNFINSTGDTCMTKAFARKDYELVLEILRRDQEPIKRETVLRVTKKMQISGLEQTLSHGQVEILREMAEPKPGLRDEIDMNVVRIWAQTPLYYAVGLLAHHSMGDRQAFEIFFKAMPRQVNAKLQLEEFNAIHKAPGAEFNFSGVLGCIHYLANELRVDLDAPNANDYSALTYAVECGLHDVAAMLLAAGANVNHRFLGGGTALVHAIIKDDFEMAKLLIEYRADARLFVEAIGRPIFAMNMSERMRRLIPFLPS